MDVVINFFLDMVKGSSSLLDRIVFNVLGFSISWLDLLISFSALCIVIAVFWRGVRK